MTHLAAAFLVVLNRHRRPDLPRRKAAASTARRERVHQQRAQRDEARLAAVLDQWANEQRQEEQ